MSQRDRGRDRSILAFAWVTFAAIFGLIGYYQGVEVGQTTHADNYAQSHKQYATDKIESTCIAMDAPLMRQCIQDAIEASIEQQRAEKDLAAQQSMAKWAKWLLGLTLLTTAVAALGVWYVRDTLIATRDTLATATEANTIMRQERRPWLDFEICDFGLRYGFSKDGRFSPYFLPEIKITNYGSGPAFFVTPDAKMIFRGGSSNAELQEFLVERRNQKRMLWANVVFPGKSTVIDKLGMGPEYLTPQNFSIDGNDLPDPSLQLYFVVIYYDGDGTEYVTSKVYFVQSIEIVPRPRTYKFAAHHLEFHDRYT